MRVIAGTLRHRKLLAPPGDATRPTADRVREALFSILGDLQGARVLDCYAGTGALGIEALSRGAASAVFVEAAPAAAAVLHANLERLGILERATLLRQPIERLRSRLEQLGPFDLVLSDPPWAIAQPAAERVAETVAASLAADARVVLGHRASEPVVLAESAALTLEERRHWGGSGLSFFRPVGR